MSWREWYNDRILCHSFSKKERYNNGQLKEALNFLHENMHFSVISLLHVLFLAIFARRSLSQYEEISVIVITCMIG